MAFVAAKCTQCGADLQVDSSLEAAVCQHCGTPFIVEKAVNNYNTYVSQNFSGANVTIQGKNVDALITRAQQYMQDFEWDKADEYIEEALDMEPKNPKCWLLKLLISCQVPSIQYAYDNSIDLSESRIFNRATRYIDPRTLDNINRCIEGVDKKLNMEAKKEHKRNRVLFTALILFAVLSIGGVLASFKIKNILHQRQSESIQTLTQEYFKEIESIDLENVPVEDVKLGSGETILKNGFIRICNVKYEKSTSTDYWDAVYLDVYFEGDIDRSSLHRKDYTSNSIENAYKTAYKEKEKEINDKYVSDLPEAVLLSDSNRIVFWSNLYINGEPEMTQGFDLLKR